MQRCKHVMIDFETLDVAPSAVILGLGAVLFDLDSDEIDDDGFYASISISSNLAHGRTISEDTLVWWMGQDKEAQKVFTEPKKEPFDSAIRSFLDWYFDSDAQFIWSNGADFDIPIMCHALAQLGETPPWKFWDARCVRTYKNLPGMRGVKVSNPQKHNAMSDALAQARLVQAIQKKLTATHPMVKAL